MFQNLFILRYRLGSTGVQSGFIAAKDMAEATKIGETWCNSEPGRKFIAVNPGILADASILPPEVEEKPEPVKVKKAS